MYLDLAIVRDARRSLKLRDFFILFCDDEVFRLHVQAQCSLLRLPRETMDVIITTKSFAASLFSYQPAEIQNIYTTFTDVEQTVHALFYLERSTFNFRYPTPNRIGDSAYVRSNMFLQLPYTFFNTCKSIFLIW